MLIIHIVGNSCWPCTHDIITGKLIIGSAVTPPQQSKWSSMGNVFKKEQNNSNCQTTAFVWPRLGNIRPRHQSRKLTVPVYFHFFSGFVIYRTLDFNVFRKYSHHVVLNLYVNVSRRSMHRATCLKDANEPNSKSSVDNTINISFCNATKNLHFCKWYWRHIDHSVQIAETQNIVRKIFFY